MLGEDTHRLLQGFARHGFAIYHKVREAVRRFVKRHVSIETDHLSRQAWDKRKEDLFCCFAAGAEHLCNGWAVHGVLSHTPRPAGAAGGGGGAWA